ncbi:MAG: ATP-dependent DNA helicase RecG [Bacteroidia bacterium]
MNSFLSTPIEYLKGVGPAKADLLKKELQIFTFSDLLFHFPYRHIDRSKIYKVSEINDDLPYVQLKGKIISLKLVGEKRKQRLVATFADGSGQMELVWFQGIKWVKDSIETNKEYLVFGKPSAFMQSYNMVHPTLDVPDDSGNKMYLQIMPLYSATEKMKAKGLDTKALMKMVNALLVDPKFDLEENLPYKITSDYKLLSRKDALINIHFPKNSTRLFEAQKRLKFEELFFIQLKLLRYKLKRTQTINGIKFEQIGDFFNSFYKNNLPFELTNAQKRVLKEIRNDLKQGIQMNRLLQGDVGSGKTVVALMSCLMALDNNYQACLMAPTEILATQHYQSIVQMLGNLPINVKLLTGSTTTKERKIIFEGIENGSIQILIGTHALIEDNVVFNNLGLAVIDEQHRFGVEQRARLWKKNQKPPHILVMTATPIPRTLAMTLYGDLDNSIIDELPAGRKPIKTIHKFDNARLAVYGFLKKEIAKGRQVYIVYPLIEESEKLSYKNLIEGYNSILIEFPMPQYQVSMVHGKMKPAEKDFEMQRFVKGETQIMVATTVIEVGVNVPNASVMVIESAEKFGLSQLHQLRGRVGRGAEQSYCILLTDVKLSNDAKLRLKTMCETNDGFRIAEVDLQLRGPGEMEGTAQSGTLNLKIANLYQDGELLQAARVAAINVLQVDPTLTKPDNALLLNYFNQYQKNAKWGSIS